MTAYELRIDYRHGVIAYVNGNEVLRDNMPDGEITSSTLATGSYSKLSYRSIIRPSSEVARSISYVSIAIHFPTTVTETPFIFDAFERYEDMSVLRVKREDEFAPIKNAEGADSPETAKKLYNNKMKEN